MIVKITVDADTEEESFFYEKDITPEQFEDVKANLEVMMDQYDDTEDKEEEEEEEEEKEEEDTISDPRD